MIRVSERFSFGQTGPLLPGSEMMPITEERNILGLGQTGPLLPGSEMIQEGSPLFGLDDFLHNMVPSVKASDKVVPELFLFGSLIGGAISAITAMASFRAPIGRMSIYRVPGHARSTFAKPI